ncbi:MAG: D-cysteine desulfhydrase family protein [Myxococcota bacterium]
MAEKLALAHLPTPLQPLPRLGALYGVDLWVKRDDATGGAEAGNKIRKLEYLLADAQARGATRVITCGGLQSNHARATALTAARCGLSATLFLRDRNLRVDASNDDASKDDGVPLVAPPTEGNLFLDRFAGAEVRRISAAQYARRGALLQAEADRVTARGEMPYVVPEGGSNGLGALGYVDAMTEVRQQLEADAGRPFDAVVHACGSGGTAAGIILGAGAHRVASAVHVMAVCDDAATFTERIERLMAEAREVASSWGHDRRRFSPAPWRVDDRFKGPAYAVGTPPQRETMLEAARLDGLVLDPVYSGKAFHGLARLCQSGELSGRVLFVHTGGLPGLMAQASTFSEVLSPTRGPRNPSVV